MQTLIVPHAPIREQLWDAGVRPHTRITCKIWIIQETLTYGHTRGEACSTDMDNTGASIARGSTALVPND